MIRIVLVLTIILTLSSVVPIYGMDIDTSGIDGTDFITTTR